MKPRHVSAGFLEAMPGRLGSQELQAGVRLALCGQVSTRVAVGGTSLESLYLSGFR